MIDIVIAFYFPMCIYRVFVCQLGRINLQKDDSCLNFYQCLIKYYHQRNLSVSLSLLSCFVHSLCVQCSLSLSIVFLLFVYNNNNEIIIIVVVSIICLCSQIISFCLLSCLFLCLFSFSLSAFHRLFLFVCFFLTVPSFF